MKNAVSIVIPNWNGYGLLEKNLPIVLAAKEFKSNNIIEIIVVDDGSTDNSVKFLKEKFPSDVKIIKHTLNRGFSAAVNTGVRLSKGEFVCLLNTDVVPDRKFLKDVLPHFKNEKVFGVSLHEKGYGYSVGKFKDGFIVHEPGIERTETHDTFWVSGGSGVFRRSIWMNLRGLDEKLFSPFYWEDVDICYRALKRGFFLLWEPNAIVEHEHESTVRKSRYTQGQKDLIVERNQLLLVWKNLTSRSFFKKHMDGLLARIVKHPGYMAVVVAALSKLREVMRERKIEMKESSVSDEAIFAKFN